MIYVKLLRWISGSAYRLRRWIGEERAEDIDMWTVCKRFTYERAIQQASGWEPVEVVGPPPGATWGCQHIRSSARIESTPCCGPARMFRANGIAA